MLVGKIQMGCDISPWLTLEDNLLDIETRSLHTSCYLCVQITSLRKGSHHLTDLLFYVADIFLGSGFGRKCLLQFLSTFNE